MSEQPAIFGCKYIINDIDGSFRCCNQDSPHFSEAVYTKCHKCCEYEEYEPKPNMPFKEALKLMVCPEGSDFEWIFSLEKHKNAVRPYLSIQFADNKQMQRYIDAWARCYEELKKLEQKDGEA